MLFLYAPSTMNLVASPFLRQCQVLQSQSQFVFGIESLDLEREHSMKTIKSKTAMNVKVR